VAVGEQADGEPFDKVGLADDDFAHFTEERPHKSAGFPDSFIDLMDSGVHSCGYVNDPSTRKLENVFREIFIDIGRGLAQNFL